MATSSLLTSDAAGEFELKNSVLGKRAAPLLDDESSLNNSISSTSDDSSWCDSSNGCTTISSALAVESSSFSSTNGTCIAENTVAIEMLVARNIDDENSRSSTIAFLKTCASNSNDDDPPVCIDWNNVAEWITPINNVLAAFAGGVHALQAPFPLPVGAALTVAALKAAVISYLHDPNAVAPIENFCLPCTTQQFGQVCIRAGFLCFDPFMQAVANAGAPLPLARMFVPQPRSNNMVRVESAVPVGAVAARLF